MSVHQALLLTKTLMHVYGLAKLLTAAALSFLLMTKEFVARFPPESEFEGLLWLNLATKNRK